MGKTRTICFCNNKGGSGKTTTCGNLGYCLSKMGKKVLMIDGDMQLNLSLSYLNEDEVLHYSQGEINLFTFLRESKDLSECIVETPFDGLHLIPSSMRMSTMENELCKEKAGEFLLNNRMQKIKENGLYDYILIDSPPTLGTWVKNLICASDQMIIPVEASPWGLFGLANMLEFLEQAKQTANDLKLMGVLITKVDDRKKYYKSVLDTLEEFGNVPVFETKIHIDSTVEWAQDESRPVCEFKGSSKSAKEYMAFAKEVESIVYRHQGEVSLQDLTDMGLSGEADISLSVLEKERISELLRTNCSKTEIAKRLGIGRATLYRKMDEYGLTS